MSQPQQQQLLELPNTLSRNDLEALNKLENAPSRNRALTTTTNFEEELRVVQNPLVGRRNTTSNIQFHSSNIETCNDLVPTTDCVEKLYQVTDAVLVICGIVVVISFVASLGIGILGISRIQQGLDFYTKWE